MLAELQHGFHESIGNGLAKADVAFRRSDNILAISLCDKIGMDPELGCFSAGIHVVSGARAGNLHQIQLSEQA